MQSLILELRLRKHGVVVKVIGMRKYGNALTSTEISDKTPFKTIYSQKSAFKVIGIYWLQGVHRTNSMRIFYSTTLILLLQTVGPDAACAYIDPNTGGYIFQLLFPIISAVAGLYLFFKKQIVSLVTKVSGLFRKNKNNAP